MIKVLIVEDSVVVQEFLRHIFASDPEIRVVGVANNGEEALELVSQTRPDVITMDIYMPKMDGFETTRRIMETTPTPIVIVSALSKVKDAAYTFKLLEAGALTVVLRPPAFDSAGNKAAVAELIQTVKLMSEVKVVRRTVSSGAREGKPAPFKTPEAAGRIQLVAIGASAGGPMALQALLSGLPQALPVPILIVQHIATGFLEGFVDWLSGAILLPVHIARQGISPLPGNCYIAPDNFHMGIGPDLKILLAGDSAINGSRPSVAYLFHSVAAVFGPRAAGVLLTGMGKDGALELKEMKDKGAVTFAQSETSSVVFGMPGEAVKLDAATHILSPEEIADTLAALLLYSDGRDL